MPYRRTTFAPHEHYHLYNRGNNKQRIFHEENDYIRFLFYILHFQSPISFTDISEKVAHFKNTQKFGIPDDALGAVVSQRAVELVAFCLMPNHFHLIVKEVEEEGISRYMQRVLNGYSKYANKKYPEKHVGHVFQGPFKGVLQKANEQLLYLSAYIHRNPREVGSWKQRERKYPWSSFSDFLDSNRWGSLLSPAIVYDQFKGSRDYEHFVDTSPAKATYKKFLLSNDILFEAGLEQEQGEVIV